MIDVKTELRFAVAIVIIATAAASLTITIQSAMAKHGAGGKAAFAQGYRDGLKAAYGTNGTKVPCIIGPVTTEYCRGFVQAWDNENLG